MDSNPEITPELLLSHAPSLRALARRLVREAAAEDVVQETWLAALERPPRRVEGLGAWLRSVLRNRARMRARGEVRRLERDRVVARAEAIESTAERVERRAALSRLVTALEDLPQPFGDAVWMRFFEELPAPEIGRRLGVAEVTVRTRIHRGLALLRERLERESGGERGAWMPALAAASGIGSRGAGVGQGAAGVGALIMSANIKIAAVVVVLVAIFLLLWSGADGPVETTSVGGHEPEPEEMAVVRVPVEVEPVEEPGDPRAPGVVDRPEKAEETVEEEAELSPEQLILLEREAVARLRRRFLSTTDLEVIDWTSQVDGRPKPVTPEQLGTLSFAPDVRHEVIVLDEVLTVAFGQPDQTRRTYEHLSATRLTKDQKPVGPIEKSPLEGVPFLLEFIFTGTTKPFPTAHLGLTIDEFQYVVWRDGMARDLNLRGLAPPKGIQPEASYTVRPDELLDLFRPGDELGLRTPFCWGEPLETNPLGFFAASPAAFAEAQGELRLVCTGGGSDPQRPHLEFALELELESTWGEESPAERRVREVLLEHGYVGRSQVTAGESRIRWTAKGGMTWDVTERRVQRLTLGGDIEIQVDRKDHVDGSLEEVGIEFRGTTNLTFEVEELSDQPEREESRFRER